MNVIAWLRTPAATLIVLCAALASQVPHAADVFRLIVQGEGWPAVLHGYAYAIALELAVLLFVVQRRDMESYMFAGVSILVNLSYYSLHSVHLFTIAALPAWLVSIALPSAIARYSHLLVDEPHAAKEERPVKLEKTKNRTAAPLQTPVALPVGTLPPPSAPPVQSGGHSEGANVAAKPTEQASATSGAQQGTTKGKTGRSVNPNRDRALQMRSEGFNASEIAGLLNEKESTVASWLYRGAQKNGVAK